MALMQLRPRWVIAAIIAIILFWILTHFTALKCDIVGLASWYGKKWQGRATASGERFDPQALTAAHRTLPLGTQLEVIDLESKNSVKVTVNDRGPFIKGRVIDLSQKAAQKLDMIEKGLKEVCIINLNKINRQKIIILQVLAIVLLGILVFINMSK